MDRVLQIPELLGFIFGYLDTRTRLSCALVCKFWTDAALDTLWKKLDSPKPLLILLSPLEVLQTPVPNGEELRYVKFRDPVLRENWAVFDRYARRVRALFVDFAADSLSSSIFVEIAQKRPSLTLLPNLTNLQLRPDVPGDLVHSLLFMSASIKELRFCYAPREFEAWKSGISEFFGQWLTRVAGLKRFELVNIDLDRSYPWSISELEPHFSEYLASLGELETFSCPLYCLVPSVAISLSQLPLIKTISLDYPSEIGHGRRGDVSPFRFSIAPGSFAALVDLSFSATFVDASNFMNMDFAPSLALLWIHSPIPETAEALHSLIASLSRRRFLLKALCIDSIAISVRESLRDEHGNVVDVVTLQTLLPLLDFSNMKRFEITYHRPFQLNNEDVGTLLSRWPTLEHFHFACDPLIREKPTLTIEVLPIIAGSCLDLRTLSLYLDTHINAKPLFASASSPLDRPSFSSLESIAFGVSALEKDEEQNFALYLSGILPLSYKAKDNLLCGASWVHHKYLEARGFGMSAEEVKQWEMVAWALQMLIEARMQERERARTLEKESRDLRMRVAMLEEQGRLGLSALTKAENSLRSSVGLLWFL